MRIVELILAAMLMTSMARAADKPSYAPAPGWVTPIPIPEAPPSPEGSALQILLLNTQSHFGPRGDDFYVESAMRILSPAGLAAMGNVGAAWQPDTETLSIHKLRIVRGGKTIDLLSNRKRFTVLRRETNLEMAMLDGTLTASLQPEDLRIGDTVDWAFSLSRHDPVRQGNSEGGARLIGNLPIGRTFIRELWPSEKAMRWKAGEGLGAPKLSVLGNERELVFDLANTEAPKPPRLAPPRYYHLGELEITQFKDWAAVSALMAPLYARAATLSAESPLKAEIKKIEDASSDPKSRAQSALRLVEQQVRYLYLGMNSGGFVPAGADLTWSRRFADCKGKTVLLATLLGAMGINAEPALVASSDGDGLDERMPRLSPFDHVIVRAEIGGKTYWLDGTRTGDQDLDAIPAPSFRWALPVRVAGATLQRIDQPPLKAPDLEWTARLDATNGIDAPAPSHLERLQRGDAAIETHLQLDALSAADRDRGLREMWTALYPWVTVKGVSARYDVAKNEMLVTADGSAIMDWGDKNGARQFDIGDSGLGQNTSFRREPGPHQDAPYAVAHPVYNTWSVTIDLPRNAQSFSLIGGRNIDTTIAGMAYQRRSAIRGGRVTVLASERSVAPEFPAADAPAAERTLRALAREDVVISAGGAPDVTTPLPEDDATPAPIDAARLSARGAQRLAAGKYDQAVADFAAAVRLEPQVAKRYYNRGVANFEKGDDAHALADFDAALKLSPNDQLPALARAQLYLARGDKIAARKAYDAVIATAPNDPNPIWQAGNAFSFAREFDTSIVYYDRLISQFAADKRLAEMLNARCWTRAISGRNLESGLADCEAALRLKPGAPEILDSKGLVELRLGDGNKAISDYDLVLTQRPDQASSLFGRGLAKHVTGLKSDGDADIAAANAADGAIADQFAKYGLTP